MDLGAALAVSLTLAPLLAIIAFLLWCEGGPILYRHDRVGRNGMPFKCLKFRTMVCDADRVLWQALARDVALQHEWLQHRKLRHDPRVTYVGRLLRRSSLDELPQLWNVIRGEMSLVGPRPVVRDELPLYGCRLGDYLSVTPGLTGLWQVMGRNNTTYRRRVALDSYYARRWTLALDAAILLRTVTVVLKRDGAW
jgi:lipopolysaccharide/colanic/teichoic acid biosynthesis glycosyltransferase